MRSMNSGTRILRFARVLAVAAIGAASTVAGAAITPTAGAPDFTLPTLGGPNVRLQEQRGRVVMINFWASWCGPCREEMPHLARLYEKYRASGFTVLAVNIDEDQAKAANLAQQLGMRFPVLLDTGKQVSRLYDLSAMPSTVLVDRDGRVRYVHRGYRDGYADAYEKQIRELLRE
jgi:thiol-disulfide isomerase/thioredoxin